MFSEIDNRHGGKLQKTFPFPQWIQNVCDQTAKRSHSGGELCKSITRQWSSNQGREIHKGHWKSASIIERNLNQISDQVLKNIGDEKEEIWASLGYQCQQALSVRCEIPYICEKTVYDPIPRSQYFLTHQLLQRLLVEHSNCPSSSPIKSFVTKEETYDNLCSKIYLETKYLDAIDVPPVHQDLFAEMGEPIFLPMSHIVMFHCLYVLRMLTNLLKIFF